MEGQTDRLTDGQMDAYLQRPQAGQHAEQRRLAGAVGPHQHHASAAPGDVKGELPHQRLAVRSNQRHPVNRRHIPASPPTT
jgi:hypothetical protein